MKHLLSYFVYLLLLGSIFLSCSEPQAPTAGNEEDTSPLSKVTRNEYSWYYNMEWEPPYEACATGAPMQNHGEYPLIIVETILPNGNVIYSGYADYFAWGVPTLENLNTGEIWTMHSGNNPWHEVVKENGFYMATYHWNELYKRPGSPNIHIHLKGHIKIAPDGTITHERESYTCR